MRRIVISINPKWAKLILEGKKKDEVRKTFPKCELPCEVFLYVTKGEDILIAYEDRDYDSMNYYDREYDLVPKNFFIKKPSKDDEDYSLYESYRDAYRYYKNDFDNDVHDHEWKLNGKVVAKFTLNKVEELHPFFHWCEETKKHTCLERDEVLDYLDSKDKSVGNPKRQGSVYAWHIDNLEIFDEPKELKELKFQNGQPVGYTPQSWIYLD